MCLFDLPIQACHARISTPTAQLGLPELQLGILPGFGGMDTVFDWKRHVYFLALLVEKMEESLQ